MTEGIPLILNDGTNSYIYGPNGPVEEVSSGGTVTYLHHDQQGSIRLLTGSAGTVTGSVTFDAYGNKIESTGTVSPLGYAGQYTSSDTGLIYMRARVYDPATAQFLTTDPLAGITRTTYNYARELNYYDPTGLFPSLGEVLNAGGEVVEVVAGGVAAAGEWAYEHPGQAFEAGAAVVCVVASDGVCAAAVVGAFAVNTGINIQNPDFLGHEAVTIGETALLGGAGLVKTGLGATGLLDGALPETWLGNAALNASLTWPAAVGIGLEGPINRVIFCE
jgi:RHS repeat-associated protein